jgi:transposase
MSKISKILDASVVEAAEQALKKLGKHGYVSKKLNAVIAASKHNITEVAKIYDISRTTLTSWIKHIKDSRLDKLEAPKERRKKTRLDQLHLHEVKKWIELNPNITINALKIKIEGEWEITLSKSTVHKVMKDLNFSYITPRPRHYKQDKTAVEEFKKKSTVCDQSKP